jgi:hypothetical protein
MNADPNRGWTGKELAQQLQVKPRNMLWLQTPGRVKPC